MFYISNYDRKHPFDVGTKNSQGMNTLRVKKKKRNEKKIVPARKICEECTRRKKKILKKQFEFEIDIFPRI